MMKMNKCISILLSLTLTGCASMNSSFECRLTENGVCASLSDVNAMVNRGELGEGRKQDKPLETPAIGLTPYVKKPQRNSDTVMRVWIAPYEDSDGYYHEASDVFAVTQPSRWVKP